MDGRADTGWRCSPQKVSEGGRVVNIAVVHAVGVNADGYREALGDAVTSEDGAGSTAFVCGQVPRGLSGVRLVIPDTHHGVEDAIAATLPGHRGKGAGPS